MTEETKKNKNEPLHLGFLLMAIISGFISLYCFFWIYSGNADLENNLNISLFNRNFSYQQICVVYFLMTTTGIIAFYSAARGYRIILKSIEHTYKYRPLESEERDY